jgi:hypothetical protein
MEKPDIGHKIVPPEEMCGYIYTPVHLQVSRGACVLYGWSIEGAAAAGVVTFFEGPIALGRIIAVVNVLAGQTIPLKTLPGIELDNGLSVQLTLNILSVTVFWRPRTEREAA